MGESPYQVINTVYPHQFQPWEFTNVPFDFLKNTENIKQTMNWFLFDQIDFCSYQEAFHEITKDYFVRYRLTGFFQRAFDQRLFKVKQWIKEQMDMCFSKAR